MLGWLALTGNIVLPPDLEFLGNPIVVGAASFMYCVEFFADKTPGVDTAWDSIHTFIRIPAGALLAAGAVGDVTPAVQLTALILGGGLAAGAHATKAGSRVLINASPEPFTNWAASLAEDALVIAGLWTALYHPLVFLVLLVLLIAAMIWLLPKIWRGIRMLIAHIRRRFTGKDEEVEVARASGSPTMASSGAPNTEGPSAPGARS
jgi:hypothetical protein